MTEADLEAERQAELEAEGRASADDFLLSAEEFERLEPDEQVRYHASLKALVGGETFGGFVARLVPREPLPMHGKGLADIISRSRLRQRFTNISWPPGFAKSTIEERGIAWWLSKSPADQCGFVTMNDPKAHKHSRAIRTLVKRSGIAINPDSSANGMWQTVHGGGLFAGGFRGTGTGQRVPGLLILDDLYRSIEDAMSPAYRTAVINYVRAVASTRLQGGSVINSHTRWHHQDSIGVLTGEAQWLTIALPAIAEAGDPLGRKVGESLWPEMFPVKSCRGPCGHAGHLDEIRGRVGEWTWQALYQGRPSPMGGGMFKEEWWQYCDIIEGTRAVRSWDIAGTEGGHGAQTVGVLTTRSEIGEYFLSSVFRGRLSPAGVDDAIMAMARMDGRDVKISLPVDPGQAGLAQAAHWSHMLDGYDFEITPEGQGHVEGGRSKVGRATPYAAQVEHGNYFMVRGPGWTGRRRGGRFELVRIEDWRPEFIAEHAMFPSGDLCDHVDAASRGYHALSPAEVTIGLPPRIY